MNQEILDKLHTALYAVSPLAEDRERIISEMGETIWVVALEKMMLALPEDKRKEAIALLNEDKLDEAVEIFAEHDVDMNAILTEVSTSIMNDVMAQAV